MINTERMQKYGPLLFAATGTVLVLWQMLLPGYVLMWDMVFGPSQMFPTFSGLENSAPLQLVIYALGLMVPMWIVQKVILVGIVFSFFYLPIKFFPLHIDSWARYAAASLFAVNPFVYERFLAGQWAVLCAYALLMPFVYFLFRLLESPTKRTALSLAAVMLLINLFSLHVFVMTVLIVGFACAVRLFVRDQIGAFILNALLAGSIVAIVSLYWLVPLFIYPESSPVGAFTEAHWKAFATSIDASVGASANVLMLFGFWGESYPWMQTLLSPKDIPLVFIPTLLALAVVIVTGIAMSMRALQSRTRAILLFSIAVLAFVFSLGLAPSFAHDFNLWLFEHVGFWRGFRDTEKWSMWLALAFACFYAAGTSGIVRKVRPHLVRTAQFVFVMLPIFYTFTLPFGLMGQARAVEYPESWYGMNAILAADPTCKALFLPWHEYYWLAFNDNRLTANVAPRFFDCTIVSSRDAEIGGVGDQGADAVYEALARTVTDPDTEHVDAALALMRAEGIRYIIATYDLGSLDTFTYPFLSAPGLTTLTERGVDNLHVVLIRL